MFWDGGATRGVPISEIPFANVLKQDRFVNEQVSTGLWSRYGHPIFAPDWWIDRLPNFMLDGEVWLGRGLWQQTSSIVRRLPENRIDGNWLDIKFKVFDTPPLTRVFSVGEINETNFVKVITPDIQSWFVSEFEKRKCRAVSVRGFASQLIYLKQFLIENQTVTLHHQTKLPLAELEAQQKVRELFGELVNQDAEGAIVRAPQDEWAPVRSKHMLKIKQVNDAEAVVIGYTSAVYGETGAKLGLIGALIVSYMGKTFSIGTGLTDEDRKFGDEASIRWAKLMPGEVAPPHVNSLHFPRGTVITFKYSEHTQDGLPKEARYVRKHLVTH
jgi:DNA ligase-1